MLMRKGFTLVELLVVITIIVILIAILTPGLEKAFKQANNARCLALLHNWALGFKHYSLDHKGNVLSLDFSPRGAWWDRMSTYMGMPEWGKTFPRTEWYPEFMRCPDAAAGTAGAGSASTTWFWNDPASGQVTQGGYTTNNWLISYYDANAARYIPQYYSNYNEASGNTPVIGDGNWVDTWPLNSDAPPPEPNGLRTGDTNTSMGRVCIARHRKTVNWAYLDGSAHNLRLGDLWMQNWREDAKLNSNYTGDYFDRYPGQ